MKKPIKSKVKVLYEVYDNRALLQPINDLPMLDRDTSLESAKRSAREWCGTVVKVKRRFFSPEDPPAGTLLESSVVFFQRPAEPEDTELDRINGRQLRGVINRYYGHMTQRYMRTRKKF